MRKLLCLAFLFLSALGFSQTATVTGHTVMGTGATSSSGISILFELTNDNGQQCKVGGIGLITPMSFTVTPAQLAAGISIYQNSSITCGTTTGATRWRYTLKSASDSGTRSCSINVTGATNLDTTACLNAIATPTTTVPTASLYWLLDGSNFPTGNFIPAANGTQALGSSALRWNMFANTANITNLTVTGTCTGCGGGGGTGTVTSFSSGNLSPLFTTSVATATTTPAQTFALSNAAAHTFLGNTSGISAAPSYSTITAADLPGVFAQTLANVSHKWLNSYDAATGLFTQTQPAYSDLTGTPQLAITKTAVTSNWLRSYDSTTGLFTASQPAYTDITGTPQLPVTKAAVASNWIRSYDSTTGLFTASQPAFTDISGVGSCAQEPAATGDVTSSGCAFTLATTIPNAHAFSGSITYCTLQGMPVAGSSCFPTIASAYAALPSTAWPNGGGTVIVPANYTETLAANLVLNKSSTTIRFLGSASINLGSFIISVPSGTHNLSLVSDLSHGETPSVNTGVVIQSYTGSGAMMSVGDASGTVQNFYMRGIGFNFPSGPALANATALLLTNVQYYTIDNPSCVMGAVSGQVCYSLLGTGAFFNGIGNFIAPECIASTSATNNTCIFGGAITNGINIFGGHIDMGGVLNGSAGIDVNGTASGGWWVGGFDCDVSNTCVKVESTAITAIYGFVRQDSGSTSTANFATGSQGNYLVTNTNLPFTDNGVAGTNSVVNYARNNFRTDVWQNQMQATFSLLFKDLTDSGFSRLTLVNGAGGRTDLNGGSGAGTVNLNWDQGTGGVLFGNGAGASVASVNSSGFAVFNGGVNAFGQADIVADSGAINTTETIIVKTPALVANRLVAGTHIRVTLTGTCTSTVANTSTFTIRMGTLGTTSDTSIATPVTAAAATTGTNIPFKATIDFTVRTVGASATGFITLELANQGITGIATITEQLIMPTMSTFNTTTASNILSVSYKSAATTTTSTFKQGLIEIVQN